MTWRTLILDLRTAMSPTGRGRWALTYLGAAVLFVAMVRGLVMWTPNPSDAIYLATGLVVLWYTIETWRLRKEAQLQTELQNRPFLSLKKTGEGISAAFYLTNGGKGLARNVRLGDVVFDDSLQFRQAEVITHLLPGEVGGLCWRVFGGLPSQNVPVGEVSISDRPEYCGRFLAKHPQATVTIEYDSLVGQRYLTTLKVENGVAQVVTDKRL